MNVRCYELDRYIGSEISSVHDNNTADHRPTYQAQIDRIRKRHTASYEHGLALIEKIPKDDLERCRRLFKEEHGGRDYGMNELRYAMVGEKWVLVPRYVGLINKVRKLKKALR